MSYFFHFNKEQTSFGLEIFCCNTFVHYLFDTKQVSYLILSGLKNEGQRQKDKNRNTRKKHSEQSQSVNKAS